jgi:hypothetical protein
MVPAAEESRANGDPSWHCCRRQRNCGVFFAGGMDGILRAVSPVNGSSIWEFDTLQEFKTVTEWPQRAVP